LAPGCAAIIEGSDQDIQVATDPEAAECSVMRNGVAIAVIPRTPGSVNIEKTKDDIQIVCRREGYRPTSCLNSSDYAGVGAANALLGVLTMGVGFAIDSASGADNKYESSVAIRLIPQDQSEETKTLLCTEDLDNPI